MNKWHYISGVTVFIIALFGYIAQSAANGADWALVLVGIIATLVIILLAWAMMLVSQGLNQRHQQTMFQENSDENLKNALLQQRLQNLQITGQNRLPAPNEQLTGGLDFDDAIFMEVPQETIKGE